MWGRYLEIGVVWCGSELRCSPRLIMSGLSDGCLGWGRAAALTDKSPPNFSSLLWTGMVSRNRSEFLVVNSKLCVQLRLIDLCKRIKQKLLQRKRKCVSWQQLSFRSVICSIWQLDFGFFSFTICCVCADSMWLGLSPPVPPPWSPHFLFEVIWTGWRTWLWASQVAGLGPGKADLLRSAYITSGSERRSRSVAAPVTLFFPPEEQHSAFSWKKVFTTDKWDNGGGPLCRRQPGFDLNPGAGWCPAADRDECVCWAWVVKKTCVCLTDPRGSLSLPITTH